MYVLHISPLGRVVLYLKSALVYGAKFFITGYDEERNRIDFIIDKFSYPNNDIGSCGYCHILSYTTHGKTVRCNIYRSIH